jgi:two-component system sensor histidine kinase HydH
LKIEDAMSGRWSRGLLAFTGLTAAGLLLVATLTSHAGVEKASELVLRGQVATIFDAVRIRMYGARAHGEAPTDDDLATVAHDFRPAGLRYLAVLGPEGEALAHAGTSEGAPATPPVGDVRPFGRWTRVGGRVRVVIPFGDPPKGPPGRPRVPRPLGPPEELPMPPGDLAGGGRPPGAGPGPPADDGSPGGFVVLELQPTVTAVLAAEADRTLWAGVAGAALLVIAVLVLTRLARRARIAERRLAEKRELERLGQMSAVLAHEMRNPLAAIKGNLQLLVERFAERPKDRDKASRVLEEAVRLEGLTESLLTFVRSGVVERSPVAPAVVMGQAAEALLSTGLTIDTSEAPASWSLDAARMERALANVLQNAVQASPERGSVAARIATEDGSLLIEVRDRGPGVPTEALPNLFEPFVTTRLRGTGLGLAVARQVVEAHGGQISATNADGGGAVLRILVPPPREA